MLIASIYPSRNCYRIGIIAHIPTYLNCISVSFGLDSILRWIQFHFGTCMLIVVLLSSSTCFKKLAKYLDTSIFDPFGAALSTDCCTARRVYWSYCHVRLAGRFPHFGRSCISCAGPSSSFYYHTGLNLFCTGAVSLAI